MKTLSLHLPLSIIDKINDIFESETHLIFDDKSIKDAPFTIELSQLKLWKQERLKKVIFELLYDINSSETGNLHSSKLTKHRIKINKKSICYRQLIDFCWRYSIIIKNNHYSVDNFTKSYFIKSDLKSNTLVKIDYRKTKLKLYQHKRVTKSLPNQWNTLKSIQLAAPDDHELDLFKSDAERWDRCQISRAQIESGQFLFIRKEDRLYTNITQMPKELRQSIIINGERQGELDFRAAAPSILSNAMNYSPFKQFMLGTEDPYLQVAIAANKTRDWAKEQFQIWINNGRPDGLFLFHLDLLVPGVLNAFKKWKEDNEEPWKTLFKIESDIILSFCEEHSLISIHDAILVPYSRTREFHYKFKKWISSFGIELIVPLPKKVSYKF